MFQILIASLLIFLSVPVFAQQLPNAGQELESRRQQRERQELPTIPPEIVPKPKFTDDTVSNELRIFVKSFVFKGEVSTFSQAVLQAQVADATEKHLTLKELQAAVGRIKTLYNDHGYFLCQVILPPQDVTDGVITVQIIEGRRDGSSDGIQINGEALRIRTDYLKRIMNKAAPANQPMQQLSIERGILLISDLPGINATVNLEAGKETGTMRLKLNVKEGPRYSGWFGYDNGGSRLLGPDRLNLSFDFNDLMGYGGQFHTYFAKSLGSGDMDYLSLGYIHPIGVDGWRLGINYSYMPYDVGKEFADLDAGGTAQTWTIDLQYPVIRTRLTNLFLRAGLDYKMLEDKVGDMTTADSEVIAGYLGLNASYVDDLWQGGISQGSFTFYHGDLDLSGSESALAADQAGNGPHTDGSFSKIRFSLNRLQRGSDKFFLLADIKGQIAFDNLGSSEKFQLGGPFGVRAYPVGEAPGDSGYRATLEGQYLVTHIGKFGDVRLITFYDWGHIVQNHNDANLTMNSPNHFHLHGFGAGIKVGLPNKYEICFTWARRIGDNPIRNAATGKDSDGSYNLNRFWITAVYNF